MFCKKCDTKLSGSNGYCNNCGTPIDQIKTNKKTGLFSSTLTKKKTNFFTSIEFLSLIGILLILVIIAGSCSDSKPKKFKDITNEEYEDFRKWEQKQNQKEHSSQRAFE